MSLIEGALSHYRLFGLAGILAIARARLSSKTMEITVASADHAHPLHLRLRTSDVSLYHEIMAHREYEFDGPLDPKVIVDAGANIGVTAVYFANRYPEALIVAVEPKHENFTMLLKNTNHYRNIVAVEAALWREDRRLNLNDPGRGTWGFQIDDTCSDGQETVRGITIDTLMQEVGIERIDILKVDIEGSEKEVFESAAGWITKVESLVVEFHDRLKSGCSDAVHCAAADFPTYWTRGETTFFLRRAARPSTRMTPVASTGISRPTQARIVSLDLGSPAGVVT